MQPRSFRPVQCCEDFFENTVVNTTIVLKVEVLPFPCLSNSAFVTERSHLLTQAIELYAPRAQRGILRVLGCEKKIFAARASRIVSPNLHTVINERRFSFFLYDMMYVPLRIP